MKNQIERAEPSRGASEAHREGASQGALRAAIALRKELAESSIGSWFADGQGINDDRNALVKWAAEVIDRETGHVVLLEALQTIADFAVGNGDVCEIIAKRARAAIEQAERT